MLLLFLFWIFTAQLINRALLANQRAIAKLFFNLMKSELKKELFLRLKWQDRVKDWKLIQKNCIVHSFRSDILQLCFDIWIRHSDKFPKQILTSVYSSILQRIYGKWRNTESPICESRNGKYDNRSDFT